MDPRIELNKMVNYSLLHITHSRVVVGHDLSIALNVRHAIYNMFHLFHFNQSLDRLIFFVLLLILLHFFSLTLIHFSCLTT